MLNYSTMYIKLSFKPYLSRTIGLVAFALLFVISSISADSNLSVASDTNSEVPSVVLYFYWQESCPLCARMKPFLEELMVAIPSLDVRTLEVGRRIESIRAFKNMADKFGIDSPNVPAVFLGNRAWIGYNEQILAEIRAAAADCSETPCIDAFGDPLPRREHGNETVVSEDTASNLDAGVFGIINTRTLPLALSTFLIALLDGVNPCSLWVLTFLLGMLLHTGSRKRVLLIGIVFLATTASIYGLFILGIVQVLSILSLVFWIRYAVALFALAMGAVNVKDFFAFQKGLSLTISDKHRRDFGAGLRKLIGPDQSIPFFVASTVLLAAGIAIIELPCTAGFPLVWLNLVAMARPTTAVFTALFVLYIVVYLVDELIVVGVTVLSYKRIPMGEKTGRYLKLAGGLLMILLAGVMAFRPALMETLGFVLILFSTTGGLCLVLIVLENRIRKPIRKE